MASVQSYLLSGYNDFEYVQEAIRNGGVDYLLKTEKDEAILNAVEKAISALIKEQEVEAVVLGQGSAE